MIHSKKEKEKKNVKGFLTQKRKIGKMGRERKRESFIVT
jgi:hypothetical protein